MAYMCRRHQWLLVTQANYGRDDAWRACIFVAQIALFQAATADGGETAKRLEGDITRIAELGCLACHRPDAFGEVVEAAKSHDLKQIAAVGERWIKAATVGAKPQ